jgi:hypothetical protein
MPFPREQIIQADIGHLLDARFTQIVRDQLQLRQSIAVSPEWH